MSSVASKRLSMLKPENAEKVLFLQYHLRMVGFEYLMLCKQFFNCFGETVNFILIVQVISLTRNFNPLGSPARSACLKSCS